MKISKSILLKTASMQTLGFIQSLNRVLNSDDPKAKLPFICKNPLTQEELRHGRVSA